MPKIIMMVHGGASEETSFIKQHVSEQESALKFATEIGYEILWKGGSALNAVECAVRYLEDNELFNAGRGSALNSAGEVEMDAAIMDGKNLNAGAVAMVKGIKNPVSLARLVLEKTSHVLLCGYGAIELAKAYQVEQEVEDYFVTSYQQDEFLQADRDRAKHDTVGAVALDENGNVAAATSTGGTTYSMPGRVGDSCIIGAGCYANNASCAVVGTGEGEVLIKVVVAHSIACLVESNRISLQQACDQVVKSCNNKGGIGVIAVNEHGEMGIAFNTDIMKRAWKTSDNAITHVFIRG